MQPCRREATIDALKLVVQDCLRKDQGGADDWFEAAQLDNYGFSATAKDVDTIEASKAGTTRQNPIKNESAPVRALCRSLASEQRMVITLRCGLCISAPSRVARYRRPLVPGFPTKIHRNPQFQSALGQGDAHLCVRESSRSY